MKEKCLDKLNELSNNFLNNTMNDTEKNFIALLKEIIVVEKETISADRLFNQLKGSYFESDELTCNFINGLYNLDVDSIKTYIDIYVEQAYEGEMTDNDVNEKINNLNNILVSINPEYVALIETKLRNLNN